MAHGERPRRFVPTQCPTWLSEPHKNPVTHKIINPYAKQGIYGQFVKMCGADPIGPDSRRLKAPIKEPVVGVPRARLDLGTVAGVIGYIVGQQQKNASNNSIFDNKAYANLDLDAVAKAVGHVRDAYVALEASDLIDAKLGPAIAWVMRYLSKEDRDRLRDKLALRATR